ncbi:MAG TPA: hypothetical protein VFC78_22015 [Tepidisphaeraceae bacterium]|nr:hypothetical protein [Tepidisphaeraceae bacterium]
MLNAIQPSSLSIEANHPHSIGAAYLADGPEDVSGQLTLFPQGGAFPDGRGADKGGGR